MTAARSALLVVALLSASTPLGCSGTDRYRPGTSLGAFKVTSTLVSSTCGTAQNPWEFEVRLRYEASTLYWVQGDAPVSARVEPTARATFRSGDVRTIREADAKKRLPACVMKRDDVVDVVVAPMQTGAQPELASVSSFKGTLNYELTAEAGSDCEDQLTSAGGSYAALPCRVQYEVVGTHTRDVP